MDFASGIRCRVTTSAVVFAVFSGILRRRLSTSWKIHGGNVFAQV